MRVKCNTSESTVTYSDQYRVEYGAPQGSCLGPLLFSIFTNDLSKHLVYTKCILFAHDTTIYMSHVNHNYLSWCTEQDLETLCDWFHANLLTLNEDKSVTMTFGRKIIGHNIRVNNICLPDVTRTKFLGIWLDRGITWEYHISRLYLKLKRNMRLLNTTKYYLYNHARKNVYYAHIYSHLTYGIIVWGNMIKKEHLYKLQKLQNKSFKALYNEEASASNFHKHKMLRINEIIKLANVRHAHKIQYSHLPTQLIECSTNDKNNNSFIKTHHYSTRHKTSLNIPKTTNHMYRKSYLYQRIRDYQDISPNLKAVENEKSFVLLCKKSIMHGEW